MTGFTRQLYDQVISQKTTEIPTYLDGPYGTMVDLTPFSTVLGIAGQCSNPAITNGDESVC